MTTPSRGRLAILVGGGPAPGINSVISSVTIEAVNEGLEVLGIFDGFQHLITGTMDEPGQASDLLDGMRVCTLSIPDVSSIHFQGGSRPAHLPGQPDPAPRRPGCGGRVPGQAGHHLPGYHRRRRNLLHRLRGCPRCRGTDPGGSRPQDHRQRPAPAPSECPPSASRPPATSGPNPS